MTVSVISRSVVAILFSAMLVVGPAINTCARELSATDNSPELKRRAKKWIEDVLPQDVGFTIFGTDVKAHRNIDIQEVSYSRETGILKFKGKAWYQSGSGAEFDVSSPRVNVNVKYNITNGEFTQAKISLDVKVAGQNLSELVEVDLADIRDALEGDLSKLLELIPNGGLVTRKTDSEYDSRKQHFEEKYGKDSNDVSNIYFASSDFVRWAGPQTAGKWVAEAIASGGGSSLAVEAEIRNKIRKEFAHILAWFKIKGVSTANTLVNDMLSGQPISLPNVKIVWQQVRYRSQVKIVGNPLPRTPWMVHVAFVIVWEQPGGPLAEQDTVPTRTETDDSKARPKWNLSARYVLGPSGCRILHITEGGAARNAGLQLGDIITQVDGEDVRSPDFMTDNLITALKYVGSQTITIKYLRNGQEEDANVTLDPLF